MKTSTFFVPSNLEKNYHEDVTASTSNTFNNFMETKLNKFYDKNYLAYSFNNNNSNCNCDKKLIPNLNLNKQYYFEKLNDTNQLNFFDVKSKKRIQRPQTVYSSCLSYLNDNILLNNKNDINKKIIQNIPLDISTTSKDINKLDNLKYIDDNLSLKSTSFSSKVSSLNSQLSLNKNQSVKTNLTNNNLMMKNYLSNQKHNKKQIKNFYSTTNLEQSNNNLSNQTNDDLLNCSLINFDSEYLYNKNKLMHLSNSNLKNLIFKSESNLYTENDNLNNIKQLNNDNNNNDIIRVKKQYNLPSKQILFKNFNNNLTIKNNNNLNNKNNTQYCSMRIKNKNIKNASEMFENINCNYVTEDLNKSNKSNLTNNSIINDKNYEEKIKNVKMRSKNLNNKKMKQIEQDNFNYDEINTKNVLNNTINYKNFLQKNKKHLSTSNLPIVNNEKNKKQRMRPFTLFEPKYLTNFLTASNPINSSLKNNEKFNSIMQLKNKQNECKIEINKTKNQSRPLSLGSIYNNKNNEEKYLTTLQQKNNNAIFDKNKINNTIIDNKNFKNKNTCKLINIRSLNEQKQFLETEKNNNKKLEKLKKSDELNNKKSTKFATISFFNLIFNRNKKLTTNNISENKLINEKFQLKNFNEIKKILINENDSLNIMHQSLMFNKTQNKSKKSMSQSMINYSTINTTKNHENFLTNTKKKLSKHLKKNQILQENKLTIKDVCFN